MRRNRHPLGTRARLISVALVGAAALGAALGVTACSNNRAEGDDRRVVVLGIDGMDYTLTRSLIEAGRLPNLARLAEEGQFQPLETAVPPQSPVAWSDFITGTDAGRHGVFDFIHRDPASMLPYFSSARMTPGKSYTIGRWQIPLSAGTAELLRAGTAFWEALQRRGIETTIVRMPANFPPSGTATRELSGMGTPDLLGSYGTFSFYTSDDTAYRGKRITGGVVYPVRLHDNVVKAKLRGPDNPFFVDKKQVELDLTVYVDPEQPLAEIVVGDEKRLLQVGEWSDWVPVEFSLVPTQSLQAIARFYLKSARPVFQLYVSPLNFDPLAPAAPISSPASFAAELAQATGRFYTQGMPEDTKALTEGVLDEDEFLEQAWIAAEETIRQLEYVLDTYRHGLLFYYFGNLDQVSHMMWRPLDPQHPAYDAAKDARYADVLPRIYERMDQVVGTAMARLDPNTTLIVMSDHGFTSWRRSFNLNSWLVENGYLVLRDPRRRAGASLFKDIDWARTRAYALGLNGLYINVRGRERNGAVDPADRDGVAAEIATKLLATIDPATGAPTITRVYRRDQWFQDGGQIGKGPDMVVGYAKGTRSSNPSVLGDIEAEVLSDNTDAWSGDHCMDHETVPGVLLTNRPLARQARKLSELSGAILAEFGVTDFPTDR